MRTGLTISAVAHAAFLLWGLVAFSIQPLEATPTEPLPVDIISDKDFTELIAGAKTAPKVATTKPVVEKIAEKKPAEDPALKVVEKPEIVTASAPPPEPAPKPKPVEAKPEPEKKADKKPEPKPEPKVDQIAEALKKEKKPEPKVEPRLDRIADILKKEKAEPKKPIDAAQSKAEQQPKYDATRIAALLDKRDPQRRAAVGDTLSSTPSLGVSSGSAAQLSQTEIDALRAQIQACWNPPAGAADARGLVVQVRIMLRQDGSLSAEPMLLNRGGTPFFQVAAESAMRAVRRCQPYKLPIAKYEIWKDVEVTFDPREMYRG